MVDWNSGGPVDPPVDALDADTGPEWLEFCVDGNERAEVAANVVEALLLADSMALPCSMSWSSSVVEIDRRVDDAGARDSTSSRARFSSRTMVTNCGLLAGLWCQHCCMRRTTGPIILL